MLQNTQEVINEFIRLCFLMQSYDGIYTEDSVKKYNDLFEQIYQLYNNCLKTDLSNAYNILTTLIKHECYMVRFKASVFCLKLNIAVDESLSCLRKIIEDNTISRLTRFEVDMLVKEYINGNLKP